MLFNLLTAQRCDELETLALYCEVDSPLTETAALVIVAVVLLAYWVMT